MTSKHPCVQGRPAPAGTTLMPVQAMAIPYLLARRDMLIQARTGSGKTGAFLLPMLKRLDQSRPHCQALVLVPTRELARQVWHEAETLCGGCWSAPCSSLRWCWLRPAG